MILFMNYFVPKQSTGSRKPHKEAQIHLRWSCLKLLWQCDSCNKKPINCFGLSYYIMHPKLDVKGSKLVPCHTYTHLHNPKRSVSRFSCSHFLEKYQRPVRTAKEQAHPTLPLPVFSSLHLSHSSTLTWHIAQLEDSNSTKRGCLTVQGVAWREWNTQLSSVFVFSQTTMSTSVIYYQLVVYISLSNASLCCSPKGKN